MVRELGMLTGAAARADLLAASLEGQLAEVRARAAACVPVSVFYPIWRQPYMTINADTYIHDMLAVCGARNVFGDRAERYPTISLDEVAAAQPEVIILPDEPFRFRATHVKDFTVYPDIPAVQRGRIHLMDGKLFCWYGPRLADALRVLPGVFERAQVVIDTEEDNG
jgi:ABC-type Fe3+-hydroxamate transport system substrate-binding protein